VTGESRIGGDDVGIPGARHAIGLVLVLVVVAQAASAVVDWFSRLLGKRSRDLEATIGEMLVGDGTNALPPKFASTSVYQSAQAAVERSYVLTAGPTQSIDRRHPRPAARAAHRK
jgi:hypothetical protein